VSKFQYYSMDSLIRFFLEQGKEGDCWDFKQEWHENVEDLIKDIVCFANTVHDENCYLIFGVSDDLAIKGMQKAKRKQADIIDTISKLYFAGDVYPSVEVNTVVFDGVELDVLTIFNIKNTPVFLKKQYGHMRPGCIYTRIGDKNTPDDGNADVADIENLWRKRLGLTKPPLEYIYDRLHNKTEWTALDTGYYNVYKPEYTIEIYPNDDDLDAEFYAYAMPNSNTSYDELNIKERVLFDQGNRCNCCGINEWQGRPITLELHHKDGNHKNNSRENLEYLCPNCHSQTENWRKSHKKS